MELALAITVYTEEYLYVHDAVTNANQGNTLSPIYLQIRND